MGTMFREEYSLTTPKDGTLTIKETEDIPDVPFQPKHRRSLCDAKVVGVRTIKCNTVCVSCNEGESLFQKTTLPWHL